MFFEKRVARSVWRLAFVGGVTLATVVAAVRLRAVGLFVDPFVVGELSPTGYVSLHDACRARHRVYFDEHVRVPWTKVREHEGMEVCYCVLRGSDDAELAFLRDAEHLVFTTRQAIAYGRWFLFRFDVWTSASRNVVMDSVVVRVAAFGQPSCALDLCEMFTEPGERVDAVDVAFLGPREPDADRAPDAGASRRHEIAREEVPRAGTASVRKAYRSDPPAVLGERRILR